MYSGGSNFCRAFVLVIHCSTGKQKRKKYFVEQFVIYQKHFLPTVFQLKNSICARQPNFSHQTLRLNRFSLWFMFRRFYTDRNMATSSNYVYWMALWSPYKEKGVVALLVICVSLVCVHVLSPWSSLWSLRLESFCIVPYKISFKYFARHLYRTLTIT